MRTILLAPIVFMFMIICLSCAAHSETMDSIALDEEAKLVREHSIHKPGHYDYRLYDDYKTINDLRSNKEYIFNTD